MNDPESQWFEAQLTRLKPARPPQDFLARLVGAQPVRSASHRTPSGQGRLAETWVWRLRWLATAAAAAVIVIGLAGRLSKPADKPQSQSAPASLQPALAADDVEIDRQLVAAYDAVARMPNGEPVRFRCREWMDEVVLRDSARGIVIEQRTPHLEVIPVSFDTY
jgi:hypothetical protein